MQSVHIHDPLVKSKLHIPFVQSLSSRQLSLDVWQKYPWPQLPLHSHGTGTPFT